MGKAAEIPKHYMPLTGENTYGCSFNDCVVGKSVAWYHSHRLIVTAHI